MTAAIDPRRFVTLTEQWLTTLDARVPKSGDLAELAPPDRRELDAPDAHRA